MLARLPKQPSGTENGPSPEPIEATSSALAQNELAGQMESYYQSEVVKQGNSFEAFPAAAMPLPEKEEPGQSRFLKLPLYRQSHNFTCGVACVASVLRYAGYEFDTREDKLLWELAASPENGTSVTAITEYLNSVVRSGEEGSVLSAELSSLSYNAGEADGSVLELLARFRDCLDEGKPIICAIQAWKDDEDYTAKTELDGHYVVLVGYQQDSKDGYIYYFMDPSTSGSYTYLTQDEFILRWHDELNGESLRVYIIVDYLDRRDELLDKAFHLG